MQNQEQHQPTQQELSELLRLRREKLEQLQQNGQDPFQITKFDVTAHSEEILLQFEQMEGQEVSVCLLYTSIQCFFYVEMANIFLQ